MSPIVHHMLHAIERAYPQFTGCSWFVLILLVWLGVSLFLFSITRWAEWLIGFLAAALFALPFLMEVIK